MRPRPRSARAVLAAAAVAAAGGCREDPPPAVHAPIPFVPPPAAAGTAPDAAPAFRFTDVTAAAGVTFVPTTGADGRKLLPETMGSGCAWLDHDGDGDPDLLLLSGGAWPDARAASQTPTDTVVLYRNDGGFRFTDVTAASGLGRVHPYALGAACADADGDGDTDVVVTGVGGYVYLRNEGGRFVVATDSGLDAGTWKDAEGFEHGRFATSAGFADTDGDGRPDLFVCHYVNWSIPTDVFSTLNGRDKTYATPDVYPGESCRLWRNLGGGRFEDVTDRAGLRNDHGKSLGVAFADLDADGRVDLVVANDKQPNFVYCGREDGTFAECGTEFGIAYGPDGRARAGMGIDVAALGERGRLNVAIGNFSGEPVGLWEWKGSVFVNRSDVARIAEPTLPSLTFGVKFADLDLDGRQDLVVANGHIEPTIQEIHRDIPYMQPVQFLHQRADGTFRDVTQLLGGDAARPRVHRGLATADADGDGDLDLCVTVNGAAPVLLRNDLPEPGKRSLRVRVRGAAPATDALGAKVTVEAGGASQVQWVRSGAGYLSESERVLTFGLGDAGRAAKVTVRWPDGHERVFADAQPGVLSAER